MRRWLALAIVFVLVGCTQEHWIARVGNTIIREEDVADRQTRGMSREDALNEVIGEALMYEDALDKGYLELVKTEIERNEVATIVPGLHKKVVTDKIHIHPYMIKRYWNKSNKEVNAGIISVKDRKKSKQIYRRLYKGEDFGEIARKESEDKKTAKKDGDLGWLPYTTRIDPTVKEVIFSLGKGKISSPFKSGENWVIIKVNDIKYKEGARLDKGEQERIKNTLSRMEERKLSIAFLEHLGKLANINFNEDVVNTLAKSTDKSGLPDISSCGPGSVVLISKAGNITANEFVKIAEQRRRPPFDDPENIKNFLTNYIIYEVLLPMEAKRHKIHKNPDAAKELEQTKMSIVVRKYRQNETDIRLTEPEDADIESYYKDNIKIFQEKARARVKIIECKTEKEAKIARERIIKGEDFAKVAKEVSTHSSKTRGGNLGWINKGQHKELDQKVFSVRLNKITPPFHISSGWCILLVEDRKMARTKPLDEVRTWIMKEIQERQKKEITRNLIEELRVKIPVAIK
ncbi:MAG: peptidylprolyl isomerase [bacterium]|nr:peptidylprolyl isomerase [bacterium]